MTPDEIQHAYENKTPVILHAPKNPKNCRSQHVGIIERIIPETTSHEGYERQTYKEQAVWLIFPDGESWFAWASEFRIAKLRKPIEIKRTFRHTTSNRYSGDDRESVTEKGKRK